MGSFFRAFLLASTTIVSASLAWSYVPTITAQGKMVKWPGNSVHLNLLGNPTNRSGLAPQDVFSSVVRGLQRWQTASGGAIGFDYWQGTDAANFPANSAFNGISSIYFASNSSDPVNLSPNVLGLTQVWYNTDTGEILETDVILNDLNYHFTTHPDDTSGYGLSTAASSNAASAPADGRKVFIENVVTHELGHAFGLSHSGGLQSTMLFMESPEQAYLGCDEQVGIHAVYPTQDASARSGISGTVISEATGKPVMGAHVLAISRRRGTVLATGLTDNAGKYLLLGMEPGTYFLMVEPFFAGAAALPAYYSGLNFNLCNGESFGRSFLMDDGGISAKAIIVSPGNVAQAPALKARCGSTSGAVVAGRPAGANDLAGATDVYDGSVTQSGGFGVVDRFNNGDTLYFRLKGLSGDLSAHVLAYGLYSPIDPSIELLDAAGTVVSATVSDNVYQVTSGFVNYDASVTAKGLSSSVYYLRVRGAPMNASIYPAGPVSLDAIPFVMVTGSVNESAPPLLATLNDNSRCRMTENFSTYQSPAGPPAPLPRQNTDSVGHSGFCGTIADSNREDREGGGRPPSAGAAEIAGWFLPWMMMLGFAAAARLKELRVRFAKANLYA